MSDKIWIIKEGLEIFGPFNQAEIIAQINNKEILETDQIATPFSRFEFLKNCEEFNLLFKISDYTEVSKTEHTDATEKIDQVDPSVTGFFDITVQKPKGSSRSPYKKLPESIASKKAADKKRIIDSDKKSKPIDLLEAPKKVKKDTSIYKTLLLLIGLISVGAYLFYYQQQFVMQQETQQEEPNETLLNRSIIDKKIGNYERSLELLRSIRNSKLDDPQVFFHLIEILILQEKYGEAQNLLNAKVSNTKSNMKHGLYHYMALINLQKKELLPNAMQNLKKNTSTSPFFCPRYY